MESIMNRESGKSDKKVNFYKMLKDYLDRKIQKDKDDIVKKYFDVNSQENLMKKFTTNRAKTVSTEKEYPIFIILISPNTC